MDSLSRHILASSSKANSLRLPDTPAKTYGAETVFTMDNVSQCYCSDCPQAANNQGTERLMYIHSASPPFRGSILVRVSYFNPPRSNRRLPQMQIQDIRHRAITFTATFGLPTFNKHGRCTLQNRRMARIGNYSFPLSQILAFSSCHGAPDVQWYMST